MNTKTEATEKRDGLTYWYLYTTYYCPQCCREDVYKERVYDRPKPNNYSERHIWREVWCGCDI